MPGVCVLIACSTGLAGCATVTIPPDRNLVPRPLPTTFRDTDWIAVLRDHVRDGLVDYDGLARNREPLDRYYALISAMGPTATPDQFPTRNHRLAYGINAYNALVLAAVIEDPSRPTMYDLSMPPLESAVTFLLDRKPTTLLAIEEDLLRESGGDVRVIFALSRAQLGAPALRPEPYTADAIDRQLGEAAAAALDNPYVLQINHDQHCIRVWLDILERREEFLAYWQARRRTQATTLHGVLQDLASPQRRQALNAAVGYAIRPMAPDRRLNRWTPRAGAR